MVVVPAGKFMMGSPERDHDDTEDPQHEVTIAKPFAVSKTEVTFSEWDACVATGACTNAGDRSWGRGNRPVINVSWDGAKQYVGWLSRVTGKAYRLLTEAEWEYAVRAGGRTRFSFGDDEAQLDQHAWFGSNSSGQTHPVGGKVSNAFGLHDMHGNVDEWVEDPWHDNYQGAPKDGSPWVQNGDASRRVIRGGSWNSDLEGVRAATRNGASPDEGYITIGFRLARSLVP